VSKNKVSTFHLGPPRPPRHDHHAAVRHYRKPDRSPSLEHVRRSTRLVVNDTVPVALNGRGPERARARECALDDRVLSASAGGNLGVMESVAGSPLAEREVALTSTHAHNRRYVDPINFSWHHLDGAMGKIEMPRTAAWTHSRI